MVFSQLTANALIIGSIYALGACGFSLIYSTNRFMHFAHGVSVAVAAYILFALFSVLKLPFFLAALFTISISALLGVAVYRFIYLPLQNKNSSNVILLIASVGILLLFENLILLIAGADVKSIGYVKVAQGVNVLGAIITPLQITILIITTMLIFALHYLMRYTKLGRQMRAIADNKELAQVVGISHKKIATYSFAIGSALAGIAGILIGLEQNLEPTMDLHYY